MNQKFQKLPTVHFHGIHRVCFLRFWRAIAQKGLCFKGWYSSDFISGDADSFLFFKV